MKKSIFKLSIMFLLAMSIFSIKENVSATTIDDLKNTIVKKYTLNRYDSEETYEFNFSEELYNNLKISDNKDIQTRLNSFSYDQGHAILTRFDSYIFNKEDKGYTLTLIPDEYFTDKSTFDSFTRSKYNTLNVSFNGIISIQFGLNEETGEITGSNVGIQNSKFYALKYESDSSDNLIACGFYYSIDKLKFSDNVIIPATDLKDDNIINPNSKIEIDYKYSDDYKTCHVDATFLGNFTDKLYYSDSSKGIGVDGNIKNMIRFPADGIDLDYNTHLNFKATDKNDKILDTNGLSINDINNIDDDSFKINITKSPKVFNTGNALLVNSYLNSDRLSYYDVFLKAEHDGNTSVYSSGTAFDSDYYGNEALYDFCNISISGNSYNVDVVPMSAKKSKVKLIYEIRNKSGFVCLTRVVDLTVSTVNNPSFDGSSTNGEKDENSDINVSNNIDKSNSNPFSDLNEHSSIDDLVKASKQTFSGFGSLFSILPKFVWGMLAISLTVAIALRILGR